MELKFETSLFDVTKTIVMVLLIVFVWTNIDKLTAWLSRTTTDDVLVTRIEKLEAGVSSYSATANDASLDKLVAALKEKDDLLLKLLDEKNKKVDELTVIVAQLRSESKMQSGDTYKDEAKLTEPSTRDFSDTVVYRTDSKGEELPMSRVFFHSNIDEDPWTVQNFPLKLHTNVIQVENENGLYENYVETYFTNDFVKSSKDKKYYFDSEVSWAKREISDKQFRFNPRIGFSGAVTTDFISTGIDINLFSYGKTKRDLDFRFLSLGVGFSEDNTYGYFLPIQYNIGNFVPLIENMFIGPLIEVNDNNDLKYGAGISILF